MHQHIEAPRRAPNSGEDPDTPCQLPRLLRPQPPLIVSIARVNLVVVTCAFHMVIRMHGA